MGRDSAKTKEFYSKLFDWEIKEWGDSGYGMVEGAGEGTIGGGVGGANEGDKPSIIFYVMVDDLDKYLDRAESMGATKVVPPTPIPEIGHFAIFADPDGNTIGLFKSNK
jgi:predicted enzyme related to lactoylglutathione lyase